MLINYKKFFMGFILSTHFLTACGGNSPDSKSEADNTNTLSSVEVLEEIPRDELLELIYSLVDEGETVEYINPLNGNAESSKIMYKGVFNGLMQRNYDPHLVAIAMVAGAVNIDENTEVVTRKTVTRGEIIDMIESWNPGGVWEYTHPETGKLTTIKLNQFILEILTEEEIRAIIKDMPAIVPDVNEDTQFIDSL
jgi:hypothetical protein